jgi:carbonic anhydrase
MTTPNMGPALERNRSFAAAGGHEDAVVFPNLRLFVITCLDPRVDPAHFLGLGLSDAIVVRNVGGRVTPEVVNDVAFIAQLAENALPDGPLFEVAVIHHTQCGSGALADDAFRERYAERIGVDEASLRDHAVLDPVATVTRDVELLRSAPALPTRLGVSGHVYDVVTGLVETVVPAQPVGAAAVSDETADRLRALYAAFNASDIDGVLAQMTAEVDWPNAWEGGRVTGHDAVREYWTRQWAAIDPTVEPLTFTLRPDGAIAVEVQQTVRDLDGTTVGAGQVVHTYWLRNGLIERMDVEDHDA